MADIGIALGSVVIFLFAEGGNIPIGIAFIVGYPVPGTSDRVVPLVVTAKHVIGDHDKVVARFTTKEGKQPGTAVYDLQALRRAGDYWEHQDRGVDIVVFRTAHFATAEYQPVPLNLIASRDDWKSAHIQTTDRVVFPSLLVNFMGLTRNYPVMRNGTIALIPTEQVPMKYKVGSKEIVTTQEIVLLDATAIPGASGSPVFLWPGPRLEGGAFAIGGTKPYVLGVLHGFYPAVPREILEVESKPTDVGRFFAENSGVAIIFPSWRLREILESTPVVNRITEITKLQ